MIVIPLIPRCRSGLRILWAMYSIPFLFHLTSLPAFIANSSNPSKILINQLLQFLMLFFRNFLHNIFHIAVPGLRIFETIWRVENGNVTLPLPQGGKGSSLRKLIRVDIRESSQMMVVGGRARRDKARPIPLLVDMVGY